MTWSDLFELVGVVALLVAAGLWDLRALLAVAGTLAILVGYVIGTGEVDE